VPLDIQHARRIRKVDAESVNLLKRQKGDYEIQNTDNKKGFRDLERFEKIFQAKQGSTESDKADVLSLLLKDYVEKHDAIEAPNPLEAIKYRMEQQGLTAVILGFNSRVTDIFNKHRKLNLTMVRKLHKQLNIPLETLVKEY